MSPRAGLDWRKISSPPGFDPGPSSPQSVAIPTELPGPHKWFMQLGKIITVFRLFYDAVSKRAVIASNNGTTEAATRYFEGSNP